MIRWRLTLPLRLRTLFRKNSVEADLREEMSFHLELQIEELVARGHSESEAKELAMKAIKIEREMEKCRDQRAWQGWERLKADLVFGWRQLKKRKVTTVAAVLSLGLAIGSCMGAFRLIDALFLRPLPIAHPERLYVLSDTAVLDNGKSINSDTWAYPNFALMRAAVAGKAELLAVSKTQRMDLTYASDDEMEKGYVQYVSGRMFSVFGLQPALGRLLNENDDRTPGASPRAVISYEYWMTRFGRDPGVVGRTFRMGDQLFEIVGVGPQSFTGTEPGIVSEIFLPVAMHRWVARDDASWHRILAVVNPGTQIEPLRAQLEAVSQHFETGRLKALPRLPKEIFYAATHQALSIQSAVSGASAMQQDYRRALEWLGVLVGLVLLIGCVNVANLMTALATARAREMALRISIGAGRLRLIQMVLIESTLLALMAAGVGGVFAWWSAPVVAHTISTPDFPARLVLSADWRVLGFGLVLTTAVALLFGLAPALRASRMEPVRTLKGNDDPQTKSRVMYGLVAAQVAFCFVVLFVAGLFASTFRHLSHRNLGFNPSRLLLLETVAPHGQMPSVWSEMSDQLGAVPGVQEVATSGWALLSTGSWNGGVSINGGPPSKEWAYFLTVSPGWIRTMQMRQIAGRDFRDNDSFPGAVIVNEAFVQQFLGGREPLGTTIAKAGYDGSQQATQIVGVVADAPYKDLHDPILPVAFVPYHELDEHGVLGKESGGTFVVRTAGDNPMTLATELRKKISAANLGLRVSNVQTQQELLDQQTVRERLLAWMGLFFAGVALLLAAIGLYGVLHYSVVQREKELGIRIALGAAAINIARVVTMRLLLMVCAGACAGLALGLASVRFVETLLYGVKGTDVTMMLFPAGVLLATASLAAMPAVLRAVRIDPVKMLRAE